MPLPEKLHLNLPSDNDRSALRERLYAQMVLIRRFEERVLELFAGGELFGTTHCYIGQEADMSGIINHLEPRDIIFSSHRCHGHFLARTGKADLLMAELMGRATQLMGGVVQRAYLLRKFLFQWCAGRNRANRDRHGSGREDAAYRRNRNRLHGRWHPGRRPGV